MGFMANLLTLRSIPSIAFVSVVFLALYKYIIYPLFLSPLSKLPNAHPTAPISPAWILYCRWSGRENRSIQAAHAKYGPVVRLGPNEISVNSVEDGIRPVYSGGFEKHAWYPNVFSNYSKRNMFAMMESKPHSNRKRMLSNIYAKSTLSNSTHLHALSEILLYERFFPIFQNLAANSTPVDMFDLLNGVTMDFITGYLFGLSASTNFMQNPDKRHRCMEMFHHRGTNLFWPQELPKFTRFLGRLGIHMQNQKTLRMANREIEQFNIDMCDAADRALESNKQDIEKSAADEPVVYAQLKTAMSKQRIKESGELTEKDFADQRLQIASELLDHLAAGHETSAIALTYTMWELSQRPALQSKLRAELLTLSPNLVLSHPSDPSHPPSPSSSSSSPARPIPSFKDLDTLPLLHAILYETLRLHPSIPGPQPRVTPPSGTSLGGYAAIPGGVRVSAQPYSLHRCENVFPEPEKWLPERWMEAPDFERSEKKGIEEDGDEEAGEKVSIREKEKYFWAFGSGGRMCVGSNFAIHEMKLVLASVYSNYTTTIVDDTGIEQGDGYTTGPVGGKLVLKFDAVV
ncbi:cytochrome P450 family protein [Xylona heveae TC161]|uniref:Cytochrome P450 family protein n=1 Tax=Xylona heveae (strain CBS 132557 / TC161) TaxID=1328760 RepID=A0A165IIB5_XYLHT|nr:cytochrome P450 family protein [Xylona heveae TC161]KZF24939.1 cytochrome P450 family protein [Xylona heveae TC161]